MSPLDPEMMSAPSLPFNDGFLRRWIILSPNDVGAGSTDQDVIPGLSFKPVDCGTTVGSGGNDNQELVVLAALDHATGCTGHAVAGRHMMMSSQQMMHAPSPRWDEDVVDPVALDSHPR